MRALCVPQGAPQPLQKEFGPLAPQTRKTLRDKFDALGGYSLFLLTLHSVGGVKTPALLTKRI